MFRRKEEENAQDNLPNIAETNSVKETKPAETVASPAAAPAAAAPAPRPAAPAAVAPVAAQPTPAYRPAAPAAPARPAAAPVGAAAEDKKRRILTVGNDILLKGEIATCDRLVIEGAVDAKLNDVHTVEIAETGSFKGSAEIEDAEISGLFEGDLVVRNRLVIYSTGRVRGKITYGEIEIERGGEMTGEIKRAGSPDVKASKDSKSKAA